MSPKWLAMPALAVGFAAGCRQPPPPSMSAEIVVSNVLATSGTVSEASRLARSRAGDGDVRAYADRLFRDHRFVYGRWRELATDLGIRAAAAPMTRFRWAGGPPPLAALRVDIEALSRLEGAHFDRAYLRAMCAAHQHAALILSSTEDELDLGELRARVRSTIAIFEQEAELAEILERRRR